MKIIFCTVLQLVCGVAIMQAQSYTSRILNNVGEEVPYATINELGTQRFAISDEEGRFTLETPSTDFILKISSIGFQTLELGVASGDFPTTITLVEDLALLSEVVVTALGIEREQRSIASSVSIIDNEKLTNVPLTNMVNSLAGQISGVQITNGSSGVGSSSRIIIRGENSLSGSNQPLFVVDGVPINNEQITSDLVNDGSLQEVDYGNGGAELSTDDIETITVLKGAGSAALYGARAANGVVLISTKKGRNEKGLGISTNHSLTFENLLTLPDYQNEYGGGSSGAYSFENGIGAGINDGGISSYGPRLDQGLLIKQFDSPSTDANGLPVRAGDVIARTLPDGSFTEITPTPWVSRPSNVRDFFETGITTQNNFAISSSTEKNSSRVSYSNLRNKGTLPNTDLKRDGISVSMEQNLSDQLKATTFINYINTRSMNRPNLGYGYENVMYGFNWTGRNFDIQSLRDYWQAGQQGIQHYDFNYLWLTNPYLTLFENTNSFNKHRVLGNIALQYLITSKLDLRVRTGLDTYSDARAFRRAISTNRNPFGSYREDQARFQENNTDLLLTFSDEIHAKWKYSLAVGGNRFDQRINYQYSEASQLALPAIYSLANSRSPLKGNSQLFEKRINSLYGTANVAYNSSLFFDLTLRNDWSSTLPKANNSFSYYSAGASVVLSDLLPLPSNINFIKMRLSAASVGNDTDPYQNLQSFIFNENYGSNFKVTNETVLKNEDLRPERLNALEIGLETWLVENKLQIDVSTYQNTSVDQIISRPISTASGFANFNVNGGEVRTRGLEGKISVEIIRTKYFSWQTSLNYSTYKSIVTRLPEGVDQFVTGAANVFGGSGGSNTVFYIARENGRVGDMYGTGFVEIDGQILYGANGLPVQDANLRFLGNYNPDYTMGFNNRFSYKGVELQVLFDYRHGGTIVSRSKALGNTSGVLKETLIGRENGVIGYGVMNIGDAQSPEYVPNTTSVPASQFYNNFYDRGNEASALYDASYLKLRQLSIYYQLPDRLSKSIGFQNLKIGFVGSNLLLLTENPHFDPELNALQERNITYGVEDMSYPSARSFGFSLKTQI